MTSNETMAEMLDEAKAAVTVDRRQSYGDPVENHERTARLWVEYIRTKITVHENQWQIELDGRDICVLNLLQKISRECNSRQRDTLVDIAGYAANALACSP